MSCAEAKWGQSCGLRWRSPSSPPRTLRGNVVYIHPSCDVLELTVTVAQQLVKEPQRKQREKLTSCGVTFHLCVNKHAQEWMTGNTRGNMRAALNEHVYTKDVVFATWVVKWRENTKTKAGAVIKCTSLGKLPLAIKKRKEKNPQWMWMQENDLFAEVDLE